MPGSPPLNLSGIWLDERGRETTITQTGETVRAEYLKDPFECDPLDGTPIQKSKFCFEAKILENNRLEGEIVVCAFKTGGGMIA